MGPGRDVLCKALLGQAQELAHFRMELKPASVRRRGWGGETLGRVLSGFDLWLKSQLPLWGPSGSLSLAGACSVFSVVPSPLPCGKCIPPLGFPATHTPQATFPELSTVWLPSRPCRARPGAGSEFLSSPNPPSSPRLLPCLRRVEIRPAGDCGTWGTGPSLTPSCFRWDAEAQRLEHGS